MTIEEMRLRKQELGYSYELLAMRSGVPLSTVQKIFCGQTKSPRKRTLDALEEVLRPDRTADIPKAYRNPAVLADGILESSFYNFGRAEVPVIREAQAVYRAKQPGEFTVEDYLKLPDECRVELIDGVFYDMAAPTTVHQHIAASVYYQVRQYIDQHGGSCIPFLSPVDVQLDKDNKTMVQPDFVIVCSRDIITKARIVGAPDFVLEVLSPSTRRKDMLLKGHKYAKAGVREYWMIDPEREMVLVYDFTVDLEAAIYRFDEEIPVRLYDGDLKIEMKRIKADLDLLTAPAPQA